MLFLKFLEYLGIRETLKRNLWHFDLMIKNVQLPLASPIDYLVRFGTELRLSGTCQRRAAVILRDAKMGGLTAGKDPTGLAAAAIYIAGISNGERRTQRRIAEVAHVTEVTVRNRYKELVRELEIKIAI